MPGKEIKLSICIATFNRAMFIGETLESLISQTTDEVEIVVLDGGSSDATEQVVRRYAETCPQLRYFRQDTNNGVDRDFDQAVNLASGDYCWLMSDDDLIKPGAIAQVLGRLGLSRSLIIVNAEIRSHDFAVLLEERRLRFQADMFYAPGEMDRLFVDTGLYLTFIGCVVIERRLWKNRQREPYFGSQFIHMGVIFQSELPHGTEVLANVLVTIRYGNSTWKPREFEIWMCKWPTLVWSLPGVSDVAKRAVCPADVWHKMKPLLLYRAKGSYSLREFRLWIEPRLPFLGTVVPRFVAILPGVLVNILALLYFSARRDSDPILADLRRSRFHFREWSWNK